MKKISIAFLAAMSLAAFGCQKNQNKKSGNSESIAKLTELRDKMCACTDKACSEKVSAEIAQWGQEQPKSSGDNPAPPSEGETKKIQQITGELTKCMLKLEIPRGEGAAGAAGTAGAAGAAGGADGTMGSGSPAAGSANGSAAAGGAAAGGAGSSAAPAAGSADGSAAAGW
jgi:hypothetical protein